MSSGALLAGAACAACASAAAGLAVPASPRARLGASSRIRPHTPGPPALGTPDPPAVRPAPRWLTALALGLLAVAAALAVGGSAAPLAGAGAAAAGWRFVRSRERAAQARALAERTRGLPLAVDLLAAALGAGAAPAAAVDRVAAAVPGAVAHDLVNVGRALALGGDASEVWQAAAATLPALEPLARSMARAAETGAAPVPALHALADDLRCRHRAEALAAARAVGIRAVGPLGLCFLPSFVLVGVVPVVAGIAVQVLG